MNLENMQTWVDALRNDTDGQCIGELVDMRGCHCVIGVGLVAAGIPPHHAYSQLDQMYEFYQWIDCDQRLGVYVRIGGRRRNVLEANDRLKYSLPEIADMLEHDYLTFGEAVPDLTPV